MSLVVYTKMAYSVRQVDTCAENKTRFEQRIAVYKLQSYYAFFGDFRWNCCYFCLPPYAIILVGIADHNNHGSSTFWLLASKRDGSNILMLTFYTHVFSLPIDAFCSRTDCNYICCSAPPSCGTIPILNAQNLHTLTHAHAHTHTRTHMSRYRE